MRLSITSLSLLFLLFFGNIQAQTSSKDITLPVIASVNLAPAGITLNFPNPSAAEILIARRTKGQAGNQWILLYNQASSTITSFADPAPLAIGQTYEYYVRRSIPFDTSFLDAHGYAHVAVRAPVTDNRGKVLVFVDSTTADALGVELVRMKNDMRGDGWIATPYKVGPSATPESVKAQIVAAYTAEPQLVKAVLLIGSVPVPYSGAIPWDGHSDHAGAWPADSYYADVNGDWTDETVNSDTGRVANHNVPGDGRFDQFFIPSAVELQVGRVDFRKLNAPAFGEPDAIGLIKRYLDKDHAFRTGAYVVENKALIDDNFGFFGGEAFAANGYRMAYPLVGDANIVNGDFLNDSKNQKWLLGYGCGGGWDQGLGGIGSSADFAVDTVNIVFAGLFGSYIGDWDSADDPFMPAALASRGGILTCSWSGRPHWFNQALASGETIGYCTKETQNAPFNIAYYGSVGEGAVHTTMLGDPTLRAHVIQPPTNVVAGAACTGVKIDWTASTEGVDGYHVYRSLSNDGPYIRISSNVVSGTTFTDNAPVEDTLFYQVRAIKTQITPGGGIYLNNSVGPITHVVFAASTPPTISLNGGTLTCNNQTISLEVTSTTQVAQWSWEGPLGITSTDTVLNIITAGNYKVVVTDVNGCSAEAATFVDQNTIAPVINIASSGTLTCLNTSATLTVSSSSALDENSYQWSTGATTPSITVDAPQSYEVIVNSIDNGCPGTAVIAVIQDIAVPQVDIPTQLTFNCIYDCVNIVLPENDDYEYFLDLQPIDGTEPVVICNAGNYTISTISAQNGCAVDNDFEVIADVNAPGATIDVPGVLTCQITSVTLQGNSAGTDVGYFWTGPGISPVNQNQQAPTVSSPGTYTLVVRDNNNGCSSTAQADVASDGSIPTITVTGGAVTCAEPNVTLTVTSNFANSTYSWTGPGGFSSTDQNPPTTFPGTYTVVVTAPSGCSTSAVVEVLDEAQPPVVGIPVIPQLTCLNPCITVQLIPISQGLVIDPITVCDTGLVTVTITGANGCTSEETFYVTAPPVFEAVIEPAFVDCDGTATISVVATGGVLPYTYLWTNGSTFSSALYLLGTPIAVTVSDASGCVWESDTLNIAVPTPLNIASNVTNEHGIGASNGAIDLTLTGGTAPFGFKWSNGATTEDVTGLTGGTYTVTITELNTGCTSEASFTVETTVGANEAAIFRTLALSPNPTAGQAMLTLKLDNAMPVKVEIRDALGRLILDNPSTITKDLTLPIDLTNQAPGVYSVAVTVENQQLIRKLVVVK